MFNLTLQRSQTIFIHSLYLCIKKSTVSVDTCVFKKKSTPLYVVKEVEDTGELSNGK